MCTAGRRPRVLMLGPGAGVSGGIAALVQNVVPVLRRETELLYVPTVENRPLHASGRWSVGNVLGAAAQYARFARALLRFRPDVVHVHTSRGIAWFKDTAYLAAGKAFGCRVVLHMHDGQFDEFFAGTPRLLQRYTRAVLERADAVVSVSDDFRAHLDHVLPRDRMTTFHNCIDTAAIQAAPGRAGEAGILFIGSFGPRKGVHELVGALAELHARGTAFHAWLAGYEEIAGELARTRERVAALGLSPQCEVLGPIDAGRRTVLLREASVFTLPSRAEGLPMAVLEAMAAGLPVVATRVAGIPEVVRDGVNGFLVPPSTVAPLAERLATLAEDPSLRAAMGRRSREIAERELDVSIYVSRMVRLYEGLCATRRPSPVQPA